MDLATAERSRAAFGNLYQYSNTPPHLEVKAVDAKEMEMG